MKTRNVIHGSINPAEVRWYEIVEKPIDFDMAEAHVELGGTLVIMKGESVYHVAVGLGPTFSGLWHDCTFHISVRDWK